MIKINGRTLDNLKYGDDTAIIVDSPEALQLLLNQLTAIGDCYRLNISATKTKFTEPPRDIRLEVVDKLKYLCTWINNNLDTEVEINARIERTRTIYV